MNVVANQPPQQPPQQPPPPTLTGEVTYVDAGYNCTGMPPLDD